MKMVGKRKGKLIGESVEEKGKSDGVCVWEDSDHKNVQFTKMDKTNIPITYNFSITCVNYW